MLLRARWVLPITSDAVEDGAVVVRGGKIHEVGPHALVASRHPEERVRDLGHCILLPGFVNAHSHLELTLLRGFLDDLPFFPWLRRLVEVKADGLKRGEYVFYSLLGAAEMIRAGVTCVGDCTDTGAPFDALAVSGLRGVAFQEVFAPSPDGVPSAMAALRERLDALGAMATERLHVGISPHSPYMACPRLLEDVAALAAERGLPVSIHVAESDAEVRFLRDGSGPIADHHVARGWPVTAAGCSPTEHLDRMGWLDATSPVQLVHLARATPEDLARLAEASRQTGNLGVAACPRSNAKLGNGLPDLGALTRAGLAWGLGTDSAAAVGACDLFAEMRFAYFVERGRAEGASAPAARDVLARVTIEAARSLGLHGLVGSLEAGKQADLVAIDVTGAHATPVYDPHALVVQCARPADVALTMVAGDVLYDGHELTTIDEPRVLARCRERADVLAAAMSGRNLRGHPPAAPRR